MTAKERDRKFKAAQRERGLVQCNVWVPAGAVAEFKEAARLISDNPQLRIGRMVDTRTGKIKGLK